jgi:hypothetical protein
MEIHIARHYSDVRHERAKLVSEFEFDEQTETSFIFEPQDDWFFNVIAA